MKRDTGLSRSIRSLRREFGMTQAQFASELGLNKQAIANYESTRHLPSIKTLETIIQFAYAKGRKYSYDHFLGIDFDNNETIYQYSGNENNV